MDQRVYEAIKTVIELGNFTRAAEKLYMSQPALSQLIRRTEESYGCELLDRSRNPIELSDAGRILMDGFQAMQDIELRTRQQMSQIADGVRLTLRFGAPRSRITYWMPLILPEFKEDYPNVEVLYSESNSKKLLDDLIQSKIQFAIMPHPGDTTLFDFHPLYDEEILFCGQYAPDLPFAKRDYVRVDEHDHKPIIALKKGFHIRQEIEQLYQHNNLDLDVVREVQSNESAYRLASMGEGYTILSEIVPRYIRPAGPIVHWRIGEEGMYRKIGVMTKKGVPLGPIAAIFCERIGLCAQGQHQSYRQCELER